MGMLSTSQAASLIGNQVGHGRKLENITITSLAPDTWFLACFLYWPSDAVNLSAIRSQLNRLDSQTDQPASASLDLLATRTDPAAALGDDMSSDGDSDGERSSDNDEYVSHINGNTPSISQKNSAWSQEDDDALAQWKKDGKRWKWICGQFKGRSPGAVRTHWYTKLREKAQSNL